MNLALGFVGLILMRMSFATIFIICLAVGLGTAGTAASQAKTCFYLDKQKLNGELAPLRLENGPMFLYLDSRGLSQNNELVCRWSLNGGSGTKEKFVLDGDFAIPILNPACEAPFSHEVTGVGFGDWYLTLCGSTSGSSLITAVNGTNYSVPLNALKQWTTFEPGKFPIKGDRETD